MISRMFSMNQRSTFVRSATFDGLQPSWRAYLM